jgi:hypothetical protein
LKELIISYLPVKNYQDLARIGLFRIKANPPKQEYLLSDDRLFDSASRRHRIVLNFNRSENYSISNSASISKMLFLFPLVAINNNRPDSVFGLSIVRPTQ